METGKKRIAAKPQPIEDAAQTANAGSPSPGPSPAKSTKATGPEMELQEDDDGSADVDKTVKKKVKTHCWSKVSMVLARRLFISHKAFLGAAKQKKTSTSFPSCCIGGR